MCLSYQGASTDMQHDLVGSPRDLDLRSNFDLDFSRSPCICFDASRREKHDGAKLISLRHLVKKIFVKNHFPRKWSFWPLVTSGAKTIDPSSNLRARFAERASKELSIAFFGLLLAVIVIALGRNNRRLAHFRKILAIWPHLTLKILT